MRLYLTLVGLSLITASFTNCAPDSILTINELSATPTSIVSVGQSVTFRIVFTVPQGLYIPYANVAVSTNVNGHIMPIRRSTYTDNPMIAKQYTYASTFTIPPGLWGRAISYANFYNASGTQLMCARWSAFITSPRRKKIGWLTSLFGPSW
jgi:hypothetical protein